MRSKWIRWIAGIFLTGVIVAIPAQGQVGAPSATTGGIAANPAGVAPAPITPNVGGEPGVSNPTGTSSLGATSPTLTTPRVNGTNSGLRQNFGTSSGLSTTGCSGASASAECNQAGVAGVVPPNSSMQSGSTQPGSTPTQTGTPLGGANLGNAPLGPTGFNNGP